MASNYFALQYTIGLSKITKQIVWRVAELMPKMPFHFEVPSCSCLCIYRIDYVMARTTSLKLGR